MVTASHNPPQDNGYKVYVGDGSQIVPPVDSMIADQIGRIERVAEVPLADGGWEVVEESVITDYVRDAAFAAAGFAEPISVVAQAEPDPMFPTVSFPNPEEPGAMDLALELAEQTGPDLVIANDPDADRCAAAVAGPGGWRMLRGDEVGALLGSHVIARGVREGGVLANSIVSSRMLATMARAAGVSHEETLTGFKWIGRVPGLAYGYEEALGYCVDPDHVKDKDGVTAALMLAELAATEKAAGRYLTDRLDDLAREHGVHATDAFSIRVEDLSIIGRIMERLRADPPASVAGVEVSRLDDLAEGDGGLPSTEGLRWYLTDASRIIVRPSGTEPKLKVYLEVIEPVTGDDLRGARERAASRLAALRAAYEGFTSI